MYEIKIALIIEFIDSSFFFLWLHNNKDHVTVYKCTMTNIHYLITKQTINFDFELWPWQLSAMRSFLVFFDKDPSGGQVSAAPAGDVHLWHQGVQRHHETPCGTRRQGPGSLGEGWIPLCSWYRPGWYRGAIDWLWVSLAPFHKDPKSNLTLSWT